MCRNFKTNNLYTDGRRVVLTNLVWGSPRSFVDFTCISRPKQLQSLPLSTFNRRFQCVDQVEFEIGDKSRGKVRYGQFYTNGKSLVFVCLVWEDGAMVDYYKVGPGDRITKNLDVTQFRKCYPYQVTGFEVVEE